MAINIEELLNMNPGTVSDVCKCNLPGPCWLNSTQQDGAAACSYEQHAAGGGGAVHPHVSQRREDWQ